MRVEAQKKIIMNYTTPPGVDDLEVIALQTLESFPDELLEFCDGLAIVIEEFPDETVEQELELADSYDLVALYKSGKEISPGVECKTANDDDVLLLYRRPILDLWCESVDDLGAVIRQVMIEEIGRLFEFSDTEIDEMAQRHYQGML